MSFRFTRRLSIIPGLRLNLSKSGASLSVGHRGLWYTIGPRRQRVTVGAPGTGLYWTETYPIPAQAPHAGHRLALIVVLLALVAAAVFALAILAPG